MSMQGMTGSDRSGADEAGVKWLTAEELDALDAAAAKNDMSRSEAIRAALAHFAA